MSMSAKLSSAVTKAYQSLGDLATSLVVRKQSESYDPSTGILTRSSEDFDVLGVKGSFESDEIDGSIIQAKDVRFFVKHVDGLTIEIGDQIIDGSQTYEVTRPNRIQPGNMILLWDVGCRQ